MAVKLEQFTQRAGSVVVVLDDEYATRCARYANARRTRLRDSRLLDRQGKRERCALARTFARSAHATPMQFQQTLDHRKAKTKPTATTGEGHICLRKWLE